MTKEEKEVLENMRELCRCLIAAGRKCGPIEDNGSTWSFNTGEWSKE